MKVIFVYLSAFILLSACSKDSKPPPPPPPPPPLPTISSISPTSGSEGDEVTISGTYLSTATDVKFNGTKASFTAGNLITATVPDGATSGNITVTTPAGSVTSTGAFTIVVIPPPEITDLKPNNNPVNKAVLIVGNNMDKITKVTFGGVEALIDTNFDGHVATRVPASLTAGIVKLVVTNKHGVSNNVDFEVLAGQPFGQPVEEEMVFKKKAQYIPLVSNNWVNEINNSYGLHLNDPRTTLGKGDEYLGTEIYPLSIFFDSVTKTIELTIERNDQGLTEKYIGEYVDSDFPNQSDPDYQRIIFWTEAGRQVVVNVKVPR